MSLPEFVLREDYLSKKGALLMANYAFDWIERARYQGTTLEEIELLWWRVAPLLVNETDQPESHLGPGAVSWVLPVLALLEDAAKLPGKYAWLAWKRENDHWTCQFSPAAIFMCCMANANGIARARFDHAYRKAYGEPCDGFPLAWRDPYTLREYQVNPWPDSPETLARIEAWEIGMSEV